MGLVAKKKTLLHANNKDADLPAHPCSLIGIFVMRFLESIMAAFATCKDLIFQLVSVSEQTGLSLIWLSQPQRQIFS